MATLSTLHRLTLSAAAGVVIAHSAWAGDLERLCNCSGDLVSCQVIERWPSPTNMSWWIMSPGGVDIPGMPSGCAGYSAPIGRRSIIAGMNAWNGAHYVLDPADPAPRAGHSCVSNCTPSLTTASFSASPQVSGSPTPPSGITVFFGEPRSFWTALGGDMTSSLVSVAITGTGNITDADLRFNTTAQTIGMSPAWGWVEWESVSAGGPPTMPDSDDVGQQVFTSTATPQLGFLDIVGFVAHEAGHALGMGHSMVDSTMNAEGGRFPTMFPVAQMQPFAATRLACPAGSTTIYGNVHGLTARDLEVDDIAAVARGYPSAAVGVWTGSIRGKVSNAFSSRGYSVVAISTSAPNTVRAGTLGYGIQSAGMDDTEFVISAVPPVAYYVYVERLDRPGEDQLPAPGTPNVDRLGFYFPAGSDLPNYVLDDAFFSNNQPAPGGFSSGCNPNPFVEFELYNDSDVGGSGELALTGDQVPVYLGTESALDPIVNNGHGPKLVVGIVDLDAPTAPVPQSVRGVQVELDDALARRNKIRLSVNAGAAFAGETVFILNAGSYSLAQDNGQVRMLPMFNKHVLPVPPHPMLGTLDANGAFSTDVSISTASLYRNHFYQARVGNLTSSVPLFSNPVNVWVNRP